MGKRMKNKNKGFRPGNNNKFQNHGNTNRNTNNNNNNKGNKGKGKNNGKAKGKGKANTQPSLLHLLAGLEASEIAALINVKNAIFVDTIDGAKAAVADLKNSTEVAVDVEGVALNRNGKVCLLQMCGNRSNQLQQQKANDQQQAKSQTQQLQVNVNISSRAGNSTTSQSSTSSSSSSSASSSSSSSSAAQTIQERTSDAGSRSSTDPFTCTPVYVFDVCKLGSALFDAEQAQTGGQAILDQVSDAKPNLPQVEKVHSRSTSATSVSTSNSSSVEANGMVAEQSGTEILNQNQDQHQQAQSVEQQQKDQGQDQQRIEGEKQNRKQNQPDAKANLRSIFEDPNITKVVFDGRSDNDALHHQFNGVNMTSNIFDIQVLHTLKFSESSDKFVKGLGKTLDRYGETYLQPKQRAALEFVKEAGVKQFAPDKGGSYEVWEKRPLPQNLIDYASCDVKYLLDMKEKWLDDGGSGTGIANNRYDTDVRRISKERVEKVISAQSAHQGSALRDFFFPGATSLVTERERPFNFNNGGGFRGGRGGGRNFGLGGLGMLGGLSDSDDFGMGFDSDDFGYGGGFDSD